MFFISYRLNDFNSFFIHIIAIITDKISATGNDTHNPVKPQKAENISNKGINCSACLASEIIIAGVTLQVP